MSLKGHNHVLGLRIRQAKDRDIDLVGDVHHVLVLILS